MDVNRHWPRDARGVSTRSDGAVRRRVHVLPAAHPYMAPRASTVATIAT